jgi:hypothetical protein
MFRYVTLFTDLSLSTLRRLQQVIEFGVLISPPLPKWEVL